MAQISGILFVVFAVLGSTWGHTYHLGRCPEVTPMYGFDMEKMLGVWYVIQKTSTASSCITYNFTKTDEPREYELEQVSQHFILGLTPLKHDYKYTGTLKVADNSIPAKMTVRFPLSVGGSASYVVFATNYNDYAAIFTCQKLTFAHRESATILSRRRDLSPSTIAKLRSQLENFGVDHFDLSIISQSDCPKHPNGTSDGVNIDIDPNTFSSSNVAGVVRKAGEKIGDGIEYVATAGKKVYNNLSKDKEDLNEDPSNVSNHGRSSFPKNDAEWLP